MAQVGVSAIGSGAYVLGSLDQTWVSLLYLASRPVTDEPFVQENVPFLPVFPVGVVVNVMGSGALAPWKLCCPCFI